jgi:hypothetical protein
MTEVQLLRPSRLKWLLILIGSAVFAAGSIWMIQSGAGTPMPNAPFGDVRAWGVAGLVLFGLGIPTSILRMARRWNYLELTPSGFTVASALAPTSTYRWDDVGTFETRTRYYRGFKTGETVVFDLASTYSHRTIRAVMNALGVSLPDTYGMKAKELATLMNRWRSQHAHRSA